MKEPNTTLISRHYLTTKCLNARTVPMTDNSGLVMNRLSYRQRITVLFPYLSTSLALSPLTSSSCTADCTVNSQVLQGHHLSLPTLALRCLAYSGTQVPCLLVVQYTPIALDVGTEHEY